MAKAQSTKLTAALRDKLLVRFSHRFDDELFNGYVLDIGPRWLLLAGLDGGIWFDGFRCFRIADIRKLEAPRPYADVAEAVLKKRGQRRPKKPRVNVASLEQLLLSAGRAFPLVTIHREKVDPDVCLIGRIVRVKNGRVWLLEIGPDAVWDAAPEEYRLDEITRVDFGGGYEEALHLVGGEPASG